MNFFNYVYSIGTAHETESYLHPCLAKFGNVKPAYPPSRAFSHVIAADYISSGNPEGIPSSWRVPVSRAGRAAAPTAGRDAITAVRVTGTRGPPAIICHFRPPLTHGHSWNRLIDFQFSFIALSFCRFFS